jgi:hypothetical protein
MLKKLSEPDEQFEQYHVGISNLKRRMALIYHEDYQMLFSMPLRAARVR